MNQGELHPVVVSGTSRVCRYLYFRILSNNRLEVIPRGAFSSLEPDRNQLRSTDVTM